jgi:hypothetical protein
MLDNYEAKIVLRLHLYGLLIIIYKFTSAPYLLCGTKSKRLHFIFHQHQHKLNVNYDFPGLPTTLA